MSLSSLHRDWWESFCHQHEKTEEEVKSLLFKGELSNKEFETLVDCARHYITDWVYYIDYGKLFASCPRLIECCNWTRLDELSWVDLLSQKPEFAEKCDKYDDFSATDWKNLLSEQPQFADKCAWHKINRNTILVDLLMKQPQLIKYCNTSIITEKGKAKLLAKHPDLAKYFPQAVKKTDNNQLKLF